MVLLDAPGSPRGVLATAAGPPPTMSLPAAAEHRCRRRHGAHPAQTLTVVTGVGGSVGAGGRSAISVGPGAVGKGVSPPEPTSPPTTPPAAAAPTTIAATARRLRARGRAGLGAGSSEREGCSCGVSRIARVVGLDRRRERVALAAAREVPPQQQPLELRQLAVEAERDPLPSAAAAALPITMCADHRPALCLTIASGGS